MVSAVAGALSFIPVLAPVTGPIALAAGGVALLAHGGEMVAEGKWTDVNAWVGLGTDMLGVVPGVGAVTRGLSTATDSLQVVDGLGTAASTGTRAFLKEAGEVAEPAKVFESMGRWTSDLVGGNKDVIAQVTQNTVNVGLQAPVAADLVVGTEATETSKDVAGWAAAGAAGGSTAGTWTDGFDGVKSLGASLSDFARSVG